MWKDLAERFRADRKHYGRALFRKTLICNASESKRLRKLKTLAH